MSYGFTGIYFNVFAKRFFRTVTIHFRGEYETDYIRTVRNGTGKRFKFKSRWLAHLYMARINKGQYHRYANTAFDCGFSKNI